MNKTSAIGIFDSGIGGLTVGHQITKLMPNERIVYFGDTKHLPYGDKSPDSIVQFSKDISSFLLKQKCKMIVVACNTASAIAFNAVEKICNGKAIAVNVEIQDLELRIQQFQQTSQESIQQKRNEVLSPLLEKAQNAIDEVAKEKNYTYIFDISLGSIVYGEESRDIMPLVKSKLGIE